MTTAHVNRIGTAVPPFDVHQCFIDYAMSLLNREGARRVFQRLVERSQIDHRYSHLKPSDGGPAIDSSDFYRPGRFPDTRSRMRFFEKHAFALAAKALDNLGFDQIKATVTHVIVVSCTGFYSPGLDVEIVSHFDMRASVERTIVGFMGCHAALNALRLAHHIVRSNPEAKVVIVSLELCTLHLQEPAEIEEMLRFLLWGDGAAACVVSAEPTGLALRSFHSTLLPQSEMQISWRIGAFGFDMELSSKLPQVLLRDLPGNVQAMLGGLDQDEVRLWAVHPGGRAILDAVGEALGLDEEALFYSRQTLRCYGNMSSATIMFVLRDMMAARERGRGCGLAFGPGLAAESMVFELQD